MKSQIGFSREWIEAPTKLPTYFEPYARSPTSNQSHLYTFKQLIGRKMYEDSDVLITSSVAHGFTDFLGVAIDCDQNERTRSSRRLFRKGDTVGGGKLIQPTLQACPLCQYRLVEKRHPAFQTERAVLVCCISTSLEA